MILDFQITNVQPVVGFMDLSQTAQVQIIAQAHACCVILDKIHILSMSQLFHLQNNYNENKNMNLKGLL